MGQFRHALPRLHFGELTPAMLRSRIEISPACVRMTATMNEICHEYRSHTVSFPEVDFGYLGEGGSR